ncbi:RecQ family ATP-dependent DNA helicase [Lysinibacillus sp. LZ02]|uniref:RecQ family ATP-dependent DNA helicase n=1 Tax=Lysinibacillus sp. LZ02 TaxID=3420668 RepID=UPI003D3700E7
MLEQTLQQVFGYDTFRPGQKEVIEQLLEGRDCIALLPTGMGKSLCYQLPGYLFEKTVLIVSPLLSLMQDQVDQLKQRGEKRVVALNSFLSPNEKAYALHFLHEYRFIFTSPEMLTQQPVRERLMEMDLSLIVADEAHCISQWGFDFRPDYLRIGEILRPNRPPILALTATATDSVLADIKTYLHMKEPYQFIHHVDRENIKLAKYTFSLKEEKQHWILQHVTSTKGPGIIYMPSRKKCDEFSQLLIERGISAVSYHAGKEVDDRQFIQQQFIQGDVEWIVATNAFGMGVHKHNIRQVIHESMPANVSNYMQEIGRAGRDGEDALAILLYAEGDEHYAHYVAIEDLPKYAHVDAYVQRVQLQENPKIMLETGEISETAYRVLAYWMQQEAPQAVKKRLAQMEAEKYQAVQEMLQIIDTSNCMRYQLVQYFGQKLTAVHAICCSNCGFNVADVTESRELLQHRKTMHWEERLRKLLFGRN